MQIHSPRGFTLIESVLVLAIIGLVAGALWLGYGYAVRYSNNEKEDQQIADLLQMARNYLQQFNEVYSTTIYNPSTFKSITTNFASFLPGSIPGSVNIAAGTIPLQYGTAQIETLPSAGNPNGTGPVVLLLLSGLDRPSCMDILDRWGGSPARIASSGITAIVPNTVIAGAWLTGPGNGQELLSNPATPQTSLQTPDIQKACLNTNTNFINLIFRLNP